MFSDSWLAQLLAVIFFFFPLDSCSNLLAVFLKHFGGGKKSHVISVDLDIMLNQATYAGKKCFSVCSTFENSEAKPSL